MYTRSTPRRRHSSSMNSRYDMWDNLASVLESIKDALISFCNYLTSIFFGPKRIQVGNKSIALIDMVAEGGFSYVYKATDVNTRTKYAMKKIIIQSSDAERDVRKEIEMLHTFKHANIIELVDSCFVQENNNKVAYLLFPYYENSLRHILDENHGRDRKIPIQRMLKHFREICDAIQIMHDQNFVHNDIKPENVLIGTSVSSSSVTTSTSSDIVLVDFGSVLPAVKEIRTRNDSLRVAEEAAQICTLPYRAPELFDPTTGSRIDARTDVWSLGCLLFAWRFGYSPFECDFTEHNVCTPAESSYSRILSNMPRPKKCTAEDEIILRLVDSILIRDPTARPFVADVIRLIEGELNKLEVISTASSTGYRDDDHIV